MKLWHTLALGGASIEQLADDEFDLPASFCGISAEVAEESRKQKFKKSKNSGAGSFL